MRQLERIWCSDHKSYTHAEIVRECAQLKNGVRTLLMPDVPDEEIVLKSKGLVHKSRMHHGTIGSRKTTDHLGARAKIEPWHGR